MKWLDESLGNFVNEHGSFKFDANNNLNEEDFLRIYDLIESVGRFELCKLRENNEESRQRMFAEASKDDKKAFATYVNKII